MVSHKTRIMKNKTQYSNDDLLVLVITCAANKKRAKAVYRTWGKWFDCIYITDESAGDIPNTLNVGFFDYDHLTLKAKKLYKLVYEKFGKTKKWFLKIDDDTFMHQDKMRQLLSQYDYKKPFYIGDVHSLKSLNLADYYGGDFKFILGGSGVLLSQECLRRFYDLISSKYFETDEMTEIIHRTYGHRDDLWIGKCLDKIGISPTHVEGFYSMRDIVRAMRLQYDFIAVHDIYYFELYVMYYAQKMKTVVIWKILEKITILIKYCLRLLNLDVVKKRKL